MSDPVFIIASAALLIIPGVILGALGAMWGKVELYGFAGTLLAGGAAVIATMNKTYLPPDRLARIKLAEDVVDEAAEHAEEIKARAAVKAQALEAAAQAAADKAAAEKDEKK